MSQSKETPPEAGVLWTVVGIKKIAKCQNGKRSYRPSRVTLSTDRQGTKVQRSYCQKVTRYNGSKIESTTQLPFLYSVTQWLNQQILFPSSDLLPLTFQQPNQPKVRGQEAGRYSPSRMLLGKEWKENRVGQVGKMQPPSNADFYLTSSLWYDATESETLLRDMPAVPLVEAWSDHPC